MGRILCTHRALLRSGYGKKLWMVFDCFVLHEFTKLFSAYCVADIQPAPPNAAFAPKAHHESMSRKNAIFHSRFMLCARLVQSSRWKMGLRPRIFGPATAVAAGGGVDTVTRLVT